METVTLPNERYVQVDVGEVTLDGDLSIPEQAKGLVAFAHGAGSSRHSPRNRYVAQVMHKAGLATLLASILTVEEEAEDLITGKLRFDIRLLARRLVGITDWLQRDEDTRRLKLGLFGSSTGAAGALFAAAERPNAVAAVVSRGGRPDLASPVLDRVKAPTLLIVGGNDYPVIDMNRSALAGLRSEKNLVIVPGATHLFEEPGTLEQVAELARDWFVKYLGAESLSGKAG
ncbi:MAG: hydrolase [Chloroflexi bacterium RBG_16_57_8]|nr:MAG: hydrolase [Chloroflexi bacterium RBG_16_57_8]